jgi:hypothetical protein
MKIFTFPAEEYVSQILSKYVQNLKLSFSLKVSY